MSVLVSNHKPLVQLLRESFKQKPIKPSDTIEEIMFSEGQQSVLKFLDAQLEEEAEQQLAFK